VGSASCTPESQWRTPHPLYLHPLKRLLSDNLRRDAQGPMQIPTSVDRCAQKESLSITKRRMLSRSIDQTMYRGSRAVLASVTCRTDPARLSFLATSDAQSGFSSTTEFASAIFSPMGFVNELIYRHLREKRSRELEEITLLDGRERERQLFHSLTLQVVQLHNQKRRKHKEGWSKPRAGTKQRQGL